MEPDTYKSTVAVSRDVSRYSLSVEEVVLLFVDAGLPRSERSIQRACKRGHFDAILGDTENGQRYFITPESVDRRIQELKQIESQKPSVAADRDASRHDATVRDSSGHVASGNGSDGNPDSSDNLESEKRIKDLEMEVMHLKIDNRAKEQFINHMAEDRKALLSQVREGWEEALRLSSTVGKLETQQRLTAPDESDSETLEDATQTEQKQTDSNPLPELVINDETETKYGQPVDENPSIG